MVLCYSVWVCYPGDMPPGISGGPAKVHFFRHVGILVGEWGVGGVLFLDTVPPGIYSARDLFWRLGSILARLGSIIRVLGSNLVLRSNL